MDDWNRFGNSESDERGFIMTDPKPQAENTARTIYDADDSAPQDMTKKKKEPKYVTRKAFVVTLIFAMVFSAVIGAGAYAAAMSIFGGTTIDKSITTTNYNLAQNTGSTLSVQEIVAKNENSVVAIVTESVSTDSWFGQYVTQGAGSGVIISEDGYIVTNNHVIEGASNIKVTLHDGTEVAAELVATDEQTDVAVIKIEKTGLIPVTFGDSSALNVGDLTVAIGNPMGTLAGSASEGIVSGLEREITVDGKTMTLIQTSASISPGNSGGGLFNANGELIGIVNAKSSSSDAEGLGFAIPINTAMEMAKQMIEKGYVARPAMGVTVITINDAQTAMQYGVSNYGVYIYQIASGSGAEKGGLKLGDRIISIDDVAVSSASDVQKYCQSKEVGDTVTLQVERDGKVISCEVTLGESTQSTATAESGN